MCNKTGIGVMILFSQLISNGFKKKKKGRDGFN